MFNRREFIAGLSTLACWRKTQGNTVISGGPDTATESPKFRSLEESGLKYYRPLPQVVPFHSSTARYRLITGGNRSGASLAAAVEVATVATRKNKHPSNILCIGYDMNHIGRNIHRLLFRGGAFKKDDGTPSPPLIPEYLINKIHWTHKPNKVFDRVLLKNGTTIFAESSLCEAKCGTQWDFVWIDEQINNDNVAAEAMMRLIERGGRFAWSTFPGFRNKIPYSIAERAANGNPLYHHTKIKRLIQA